MRKYLRALYSFAIILVCSLVMFGCGVKIEDITVKTGTIDTTIAKNTALVTDKFEAVVKYSDDTKKTITSEDVTFGTIDTTTTGKKDLEVTFEDYTFVIKITVVETSADIATVTMFSSSILTDYNSNRAVESDKEEGFKLREEPYYVGDDNLFNFRINAKGIDGAGNIKSNLSNIRTNVEF